jgi:hypothetical protein
MSDVRKDPHAKKAEKSGSAAKSKRPYTKPDFQHEKVFETMALACGKLSPTQAQCRFNRRNS